MTPQRSLGDGQRWYPRSGWPLKTRCGATSPPGLPFGPCPKQHYAAWPSSHSVTPRHEGWSARPRPRVRPARRRLR